MTNLQLARALVKKAEYILEDLKYNEFTTYVKEDLFIRIHIIIGFNGAIMTLLTHESIEKRDETWKKINKCNNQIGEIVGEMWKMYETL